MNALIVAMWSGPRNLSTALMRSFAQRPDTDVWDEPFYAAYLKATGLDHPMAAEIIAEGITEPRKVARACIAPPKPPKRVFYQKHMTHHILEDFETGWIGGVTNAFLIRSPERVLASYVRKHDAVEASDIGFSKQRELFDRAAERLGAAPPVIDSTDIRRNPEAAMRALTGALGLEFDPAMLSWNPGPIAQDGIWGKHWYDAIWNSTGFAPPEAAAPALPGKLQKIADAVQEDYLHLRRFALAVK